MKVAILQTGAPPAELEVRFGSYPEMLMTLLGHDGFDYEVFDVQAGPLPKRGDHHGVVIMGSPSGVYDGDAWIQDLKMWIIGAQGRCRMVGICFGHQIIGEANGCDVRKSERGWGIGVHSYQVEDRHGWMEPPLETVRLPVSHQDQVEYRGASTWVTLTSRFCPYAGLIHGRDTISFQGHPEFTPEFARALIEHRGDRYPPHFARQAFASLDGSNDREVVAQWIRNFLREPIDGSGRI
jgi:GMP synthase-like glutamine amidotransferase